MTIQELSFVTYVYEQILTGSTNCAIINAAYKIIDPKYKLKSKKQKIKYIRDYWEKLADQTLANYLINRQTKDQKPINKDDSNEN